MLCVLPVPYYQPYRKVEVGLYPVQWSRCMLCTQGRNRHWTLTLPQVSQSHIPCPLQTKWCSQHQQTGVGGGGGTGEGMWARQLSSEIAELKQTHSWLQTKSQPALTTSKNWEWSRTVNNLSTKTMKQTGTVNKLSTKTMKQTRDSEQVVHQDNETELGQWTYPPGQWTTCPPRQRNKLGQSTTCPPRQWNNLGQWTCPPRQWNKLGQWTTTCPPRQWNKLGQWTTCPPRQRNRTPKIIATQKPDTDNTKKTGGIHAHNNDCQAKTMELNKSQIIAKTKQNRHSKDNQKKKN